MIPLTSTQFKSNISTTNDKQASKESAPKPRFLVLNRNPLGFEALPSAALTTAPLTSELYSRLSASSAQETAYLSKIAWLNTIRIALTCLVVSITLAIVGCTTHVLHNYNNTNLAFDYHLALWPSNIDLRPTIALLISSGLTTLAGVVYMIIHFLPSPHSRSNLLNRLFLITTTVGAIVSIFSIAFYTELVYNNNSRETLQSFTCKIYNGANSFVKDANAIQISIVGFSAPDGFHQICVESMSSLGLMIALLIAELACYVVTLTTIKLENNIENLRKSRNGDKWHRK